MNNLDKVYELVKQLGPVLPVEVASKLGVDSFLANAYLLQLVESKKLKATKERVGNAFVYFIDGQEGTANSRVASLLKPSGKTARMFAETVPEGPAVEQKRQAFADRLQEIEKKEVQQKVLPKPQIQRATIAERVKQEFLDRFRPAIAEQLNRQEVKPVVRQEVDEKKLAQQVMQEVQQRIAERKKVLLDEGKLVDNALAFLVDAHADIIGKDLKKKGRDADIVATVPTPIGPVRFLVLVRDKKTVSEADLSLAFTEGQNRKLPILFVTNGKLTKTASNYLNVISVLVKFKNLG